MSTSRVIYNFNYIFISVLISTLLRTCHSNKDQNGPALDFNDHDIIQPIVYHGRPKREIITTKDKSGAHHSRIQLMVPVEGEQYILQLNLNTDIIPDSHTLMYQKDGRNVQHKFNKEQLDLCHYVGNVRNKPGSWAAVSTCHGISGVVFDGQTMRYIEPVHGSNKSLHYLYNHNNLNTIYNLGRYDGINSNAELLQKWGNIKNPNIRDKREANNHVRSPYSANATTRYVELVLVVDHREFEANQNDIKKVHSNAIELVNIANSLFSPLNIYIGLVGVVVWNERDEIEFDANADVTLVNFLEYRRRKLTFDIRNDYANLITRQIFEDDIIGKSLNGLACTFDFSGGVVAIHSSVVGVNGATVAHVLGHNLGMEHDTENCKCQDSKCIMNSNLSAEVTTHWSSCSVSSLKEAFDRGIDYCLRNKPKRLFNSPTCGNGFVEPGEECDCGIIADEGNISCHKCCNPETCMLRVNATCGAGACCDFKTCRLKSVGMVCRAANGECDLPEFCTGKSEFCPDDVYWMDSTPCGEGENQAYCVRGTCRSHLNQCRLLWGPTVDKIPMECYKVNMKGTINGNCGHNFKNGTFKRCALADTMCGVLQCHHPNNRLMFGIESVSKVKAFSIYNKGRIISCRTATIDFGANDVNPGLVPDGAKCGEERMCLKQKCVPVEDVEEMIMDKDSSVCPSDCSGHGVCNSEGHCHCDQGYAPPLCSTPGAGGSVDSGPASDLVRLSDMFPERP